MDRSKQSLYSSSERADIQAGLQSGQTGEEKMVNPQFVLSEQHKEHAIVLANQIDLKNHESILTFGAPAQSKLVSFSNTMLRQVQKKDIRELGNIMSDLVIKLNEVSPDELMPVRPNFFGRLFGKKTKSVQEVLSKFQKIGAAIDRINVKLDRGKSILLEDINTLDRLNEDNRDYFMDLNVYIAAGEIKLDKLRREIIPELEAKAKTINDPMKLEEINHVLQCADLLDKRVYDLKLSRELTLQSAIQIRMIQNSNQVLSEKIQSSIMTVIPLWKNQVSIAMAVMRQYHSSDLHKQFSNLETNLVLKNSAALNKAHDTPVHPSAIESLKKTTDELIILLKDTMKIQEEGHNNRMQAQQELQQWKIP